MGRLDILAKEYMRRPSIFADVFNQFLYHARQVAEPEKLAKFNEFQSSMREIMCYVKYS